MLNVLHPEDSISKHLAILYVGFMYDVLEKWRAQFSPSLESPIIQRLYAMIAK